MYTAPAEVWIPAWLQYFLPAQAGRGSPQEPASQMRHAAEFSTRFAATLRVSIYSGRGSILFPNTQAEVAE